jgi:succinate dehydrogenase / fumarate reductase flavoprotein subunit
MYNDIPEPYRNQTANDPEEGWRYCQGDRNANRPAELLTRDHVARCILSEVRAGRGTPHGGVWLDIAWIKQKIANAPEHIKRKLPSMYHQFKELGGIDITKEPMEVGPTTHYVMGGVRVDAESQMSRVPGLFACGECAVGINGANRLGGNSLSDLLVFGKRAGEFAGKYAQDHTAPQLHADQLQEAARWALAPFERSGGADGPYKIQQDLQEMMQELVGIVRREEEMQRALEGLDVLRERAARATVTGNREYNPGWHTALDLHYLLTVCEAIARSGIARKESRGGHFRDDHLDKVDRFGKVNLVVRKGPDGRMQLEEAPIPEMPPELLQIIEEMK